MTSQTFLFCDSSTVAMFKQWGQAISTAFSTVGWTQSSDTGQVSWGSISSVPAANAYVYEVWTPNDGLTNFYLKVEYGNGQGQTNLPTVRLSIATATNGSGTLTGLVMGPLYTNNIATYTTTGTTTSYECDFSGAAGRFAALMWRNAPNGAPQFFGVERSVNSSGTYTSSHVTVVTAGPNTNSGNRSCVNQQTYVFGLGPAPGHSIANASTPGGLAVRVFQAGNTANTSGFNNSIGFDTIAPYIGYYDYPLTMVGAANYPDIVEAVTFQVTLYGATRTYLPTSGLELRYAGPRVATIALCMRYD